MILFQIISQTLNLFLPTISKASTLYAADSKKKFVEKDKEKSKKRAFKHFVCSLCSISSFHTSYYFECL